MAFNNNGGTERFPINTQSLIFFSDNVMMSLKFSDNICIVSFRDAKYDENGKRSFPRPTGGDKDLSAILTREKAAAFMNRIRSEFIPKFQEYVDTRNDDTTFNKGFSIGVATNKDLTNVLSISTGKPESGPYIPEIVYSTDIDAATRLPKTVKVFKMTDTVPVIIGYDPSTGDFESIETEYPQIITFITALDEFVKSQCNGTVHQIESRYGNTNYKTRTTINQIAMKNGIQIEAPAYQQKTGNTQAFTQSAPPALELKQFDGDMAAFMQMTGASDSNPF